MAIKCHIGHTAGALDESPAVAANSATCLSGRNLPTSWWCRSRLATVFAWQSSAMIEEGGLWAART